MYKERIMGNVGAKNQNPEALADHYQTGLKLMDETVQAYQKYKTPDMLDILKKNHHVEVPESIIKIIREQHIALNGQLDANNITNPTDTDVLNLYIKGITNSRELAERRQRLFDNKMVQDIDRKSQNVVGNLFDSLNNTYGKYRFFEFKYIQTNLLILILCSQIGNFYQNIVFQTKVAIDGVRTDLLDDLTKVLESIGDLKVDSDITPYQKLGEKVSETIKNTNNRLNDTVTKLEDGNNGLKDILQTLLEKDQAFMNVVADAVKEQQGKTARATANAARPSPTPSSGGGKHKKSRKSKHLVK